MEEKSVEAASGRSALQSAVHPNVDVLVNLKTRADGNLAWCEICAKPGYYVIVWSEFSRHRYCYECLPGWAWAIVRRKYYGH